MRARTRDHHPHEGKWVVFKHPARNQWILQTPYNTTHTHPTWRQALHAATYLAYHHTGDTMPARRIDPMTWALKQRRIQPTDKLTLIALAHLGTPDGRNNTLSFGDISLFTNTATSAVAKSIARLHAKNLIYPGDPQAAAHIPEAQRPKVWTLNITSLGAGQIAQLKHNRHREEHQ